MLILQTLLGFMLVSLGVQNFKNKENRSVGRNRIESASKKTKRGVWRRRVSPYISEWRSSRIYCCCV
ncbi:MULTISPECIES: YczI family protein [Bacillus]